MTELDFIGITILYVGLFNDNIDHTNGSKIIHIASALMSVAYVCYILYKVAIILIK